VLTDIVISRFVPRSPANRFAPNSTGTRPPELTNAMQQHLGGKVPALSPKKWLCI
jgi:hypothetical protein